MEHNLSIAFRPAFDRDLDFLYQLHVATMKDYVDRTWGWEDAFQESVFRKRYVPAEIQIMTCEGRDMGMISVEERQADIFLRAIEIHPDFQGQGIATGIINNLIADGRRKMKPIRLYVLKVNPAKRLYDRLGFSVIEETPTHYIMLTSMSK
jgi:ribosomal protein S18 acetylase RimI-like enzyme